MNSEQLYLLAADGLLAVHVLTAAFIVLGLVFVLAGKALSWGWVRNPWFRLAHLIAIGIVVLQAWLGQICPLTTWEMALRRRGGGATYEESFIGYWLGELLYYQAPPWVFVLVYTLFGLAVAASWFWVRPSPFGRPRERR